VRSNDSNVSSDVIANVSQATALKSQSKGFSSSFLERELELLSGIVSGDALVHHLEPSYFSSLADLWYKISSDEI
jgi:hypothetical protein